jgi:hypothetical protein
MKNQVISNEADICNHIKVLFNDVAYDANIWSNESGKWTDWEVYLNGELIADEDLVDEIIDFLDKELV